ncbi:MAG: magnesium/cobalt transporter CorA [Patescibacteria group bacterium]|jgi:magnesium transporter
MTPTKTANHRVNGRVTVFDYNAKKLEKFTSPDLSQYGPLKQTATVTWIDIDGPRQSQLIESLSKNFGLHPLVLEDLANRAPRAKVEDYGNYIHLVINMIGYDEKRSAIIPEQVNIVFFPNLILSCQEGREGDVFGSLRQRLENPSSRLRQLGADYLFYSLIDAVADHYFAILENVGEKIDWLEEELIKNPSPKALNDLRKIKREVIYLRKSIWPLREILGSLERRDSSLIKKSTWFYFRDVYNHTVQIIDTIETYRDIISGMLEVYLSGISNRLNEIMKVLTVISTIFIPLTFIAGVYGMNFRYMPELDEIWGYPLALMIMLLTALGLILFFKRRRWF